MSEPIQVQKSATVEEIVEDHINGLGGYAIAEKYGLDTDVVKRIIADADARHAFVPEGVEPPVDSINDPVIVPLKEGEEPQVKTGKTTTANHV